MILNCISMKNVLQKDRYYYSRSNFVQQNNWKNWFIKDLNINFYHCPWMRIEWGSNTRTPKEEVFVFVRMKKLYEG